MCARGTTTLPFSLALHCETGIVFIPKAIFAGQSGLHPVSLFSAVANGAPNLF